MHEDQSATVVECRVCEREEGEVSRSVWSDRRLVLVVTSGIFLGTGLVIKFIFLNELITQILFLVTAVLSGYTIAREGLVSLLLRRRLSIDFLIVIASIGSFLIGHSEEGAAVVFLFYIAEFLEDHASDRARRSILALMKLAPDSAIVQREGGEQEVHVHEVGVGEVIVVRPGEKIPLDGTILQGSSHLNQAPITGESMPIFKQVGDEVYAGTINNEGFLEIRVTKQSDETMLSKIITLIEDAQDNKSSTETFIDKFAHYYTPSVILLAVSVVVLPTLVLGLPFYDWLYKALILLVVSCPCALAISTPVAMVSGITSAARNGVLIKGSTYIEAMNHIRVFAFDKTGTLTEGRLEVTDVIGFGYSPQEVLLKAACIEGFSEHPIAKAILRAAAAREVYLQGLVAKDFRAITGKGATCAIDGVVYYVGSGRMFQEESIDFPEEPVSTLENEGKTVILIGDRDQAIGLVAVRDQTRSTAIATVHQLKSQGMRTEMLTGDNERTAKTIAREIGVDEYHAELLPDDKVDVIRDHLTDFGHVAMVGDGINDAPALAQAKVGIAMGAIGSDVALETADIALMQDDLTKLPYLVELSRKTMTIVKQNILLSLLIKGSFAILAFPGLVTLWLAVAIGDMGLSLGVILNSMRVSTLKS